MGRNKPLRLPYRFERPRPSHSPPCWLMGLLRPIILILLRAVDRLGYQFAMSNTVAATLVRYDLPGFIAMAS
jgi:hypothetical protein